MQITDPGQAKQKLYDLYSADGYVNWFLKIRWWHANLSRVAEFVPEKGTVLDLGCGYGMFANFLGLTAPERNVIGIEMNSRKIKYADKKIPNVQFMNDDITKLKLPPCDAVILLDVLHHLQSFDEQEKFLRYCVGLLSDTGVLLVKEINDTPKWKFIFTTMIDNTLYFGDTFYFRGERDFRGLFDRLGLDVEFHTIHEGKPLSHVLYVARKRK